MAESWAEVVKVVKPFLDGLRELLKESLIEISIFGSTVRGESRPGSDVDVLVLVKGDREEALKVIDSIYSSLGEEWIRLAAEGYVLELAVMGESEWKAMLKENFSFSVGVEGEKFTVFRRD